MAGQKQPQEGDSPLERVTGERDVHPEEEKNRTAESQDTAQRSSAEDETDTPMNEER